MMSEEGEQKESNYAVNPAAPATAVNVNPLPSPHSLPSASTGTSYPAHHQHQSVPQTYYEQQRKHHLDTTMTTAASRSISSSVENKPPPAHPLASSGFQSPAASAHASAASHAPFGRPKKGPHHPHDSIIHPHQSLVPPALISKQTPSFVSYFGLPFSRQPSPNLKSFMMQQLATGSSSSNNNDSICCNNDSASYRPTSKAPPPNKQRRSISGKKKKARNPKKKVKKSRQAIEIEDEDPKRLVNPLIEIPMCEKAPHSTDLHIYSSLTHYKPDTYPLVYYARVLGFDVPPVPPKSRVAMDPSSLPLVKDATIFSIPPLGTRPIRLEKLDYYDPVFKALQSQDLPPLTPATNIPELSSELIEQILHELPPMFILPKLESNDNGLFCIHLEGIKCFYEFAWFRASQRVSELVLHVHTLTFGDVTLAAGDIIISSEKQQQLLAVVCCVLEHARSNSVWYGLWHVPKNMQGFLETYLGMIPIPASEHCPSNVPGDKVALLCDLHQCSSRHAGLLFQQGAQQARAAATHTRQRMLVLLPTLEEGGGKRSAPKKPCITSAKESLRWVAFGVRLSKSSSSTTLGLLNAQGQVDRLIEPSSTSTPLPSWLVLKSFEQVVPSQDTVEQEDEILLDLKKMQSELAALEGSMETKVRSLLQQVVDLRMDYEMTANKRREEKAIIKKYTGTIERRKEADLVWQKQLERDMDAVCDICRDGEVTPDNQILFCEACNVAVHQMCYGIEEVPEGDYYCIACRYFNRGKMSAGKELKRIAPSPLPICCELCPAKQGAFIRSAHDGPEGVGGLFKWVHVVCAKWQGLDFEPLGQTDVVEDVSEIKLSFLRLGHKCILCLGRRGAYAKCRQEGCDSWIHITCARATGLCEVVHGENCHGPVDDNPWTLLCPEHSTVEPGAVRDRVSIDQLVRTAEEFPPEPMPEPLLKKIRPTKVFNKMSADERRIFLADPEYEQNLLAELSRKLHGVHCEVCHQFEEDGKNLTRCGSCNVVFCASCVLPCDVDCEPKDYRCPACLYVKEKKKAREDFEQPQCHMCHQKGGWLRRAYANPVNRKVYWKNNPKEYAKTLFAKDLFCHALCSMWNPQVAAASDGTVDCSDIIMNNGREHILGNTRCNLCGSTSKMKVCCSDEGCRAWGQKRGPYRFHVTCARDAGLEVKDKADADDRFYFDTKCFRHSGSDFVFRARCEDLIELERRRTGKHFKQVDMTMSLAHASRLYNKSIVVMKMLGWAWRWAEWWVEYSDNWEPLLEPGEKEENMTKEELKIVDSTQESRCEAARKCRLTALSAALRNREYDKEVGDDIVALDRALRALLHTPELVGPLESCEIDFFAEWLGRAYRSKSRLLGYGEDKIPIRNAVGTVHIDDKTPKYILGSRRLPGKQELPDGIVFETDINDVDDFLKPETYEDGTLVTPESLKPPKKERVRKNFDSESKKSKLSMRGTKSPLGSVAESTFFSLGDGAEAATLSETAPVDTATATPKRRGRPPKSAGKKAGSSPEKKGLPPKTTDVKAGSTAKKMKRPPVGETTSSPKKTGRRPKSIRTPDTHPSADAGDTAVGAGSDIAVRNKKRRRSPETMQELPNKRTYVRRKRVDKKEQDDDGTLPYAESVSILEEATDDDDITVASYVRRWKQSQGETLPTEKVGSESSDDSSECESETPLSEMTMTQRGRRQGKMQAVSMMWSGS